MTPETGLIVLILITLFAAIVNGALGYGFSSLTVPVALLFYTSRVLSPALVLVEVVLNIYVLFVNRRSFFQIWRRVVPIVIGLVPGIIVGSYALSQINPGVMKVITYAVLLPLILLQASGLRRPVRAESVIAAPVGLGVGLLYSVTTISGPPLALLLNNQGLKKEDFRAALGLVRVFESSLTAIAYYTLGLFTVSTIQLLPAIFPSVVIGLPIGVLVIRRMNHETFRRICMSFDAWVVGFGLSQALIALKLLTSPNAYGVLALAAAIDLILLYRFFSARRASPAMASVRQTA
jgi:uncharacterized membrane protein YfcA